MTQVFETLLSNPLYLGIGVVVGLLLLFFILKKLFKLFLIGLFLFVLFLIYVYFTGGSVESTIEKTKTESQRIIQEGINEMKP